MTNMDTFFLILLKLFDRFLLLLYKSHGAAFAPPSCDVVDSLTDQHLTILAVTTLSPRKGREAFSSFIKTDKKKKKKEN